MEDLSSADDIVVKAPIVGNISFGGNWERRKQALAMFTASLYFILPMVMLCWTVTLVSLFRTATAVPVLMYLGYIYVIDRSPSTGNRRPFLRGFRTWWSHSCDYLPLLLVRTADLDPKGKYVIGYHPHGIISVGCFGAFATDGARTMSLTANSGDNDRGKGQDGPSDGRGFSSLFPGIDRRVITLPQNFQTPFLREYFLSMGACTSSKETFRNVLAKSGGRAVVVVVGGAAESLLVKSGSMDLVLQKRRGFVREAILANASLVPAIGFGETDLYQTFDHDENHWIGRFQRFVKKTTGFGMPIFQGRSLLFKDFGIMPERKPVVVVVGAPIAPPNLDAAQRDAFKPDIDHQTGKARNKDGETLIEWHKKYVKALEELFTKHKDQKWNQPGKERRRSLKIVR